MLARVVTAVGLAAALGLVLFAFGCAGGSSGSDPDRVSVRFTVGNTAEAQALGLSGVQSAEGYSVELESGASAFDIPSHRFTCPVTVHNRSTDSTRTMYDVEARVCGLTPSETICGEFDFEVEVTWYRTDGPHVPSEGSTILAGTGYSCEDADWNYGDVSAGVPSAPVTWTFTTRSCAPTELKWDRDYDRTVTATNPAPKDWNRPGGIALGHDGSLFVSDTKNHQVVAFGPAGTVAAVYGTGTAGSGKPQLDSPFGLAEVPPGVPDFAGDLYIANTDQNRIVRWKRSMTNWAKALFIVAGLQMQLPQDAVVTEEGDLLAVDTLNSRVIHSQLSFSLAWAYGSSGSTDDRFSGPKGIALGPDGLVYVSDTGNERIARLSFEYDSVEGRRVLDWHDSWRPGLQEPRGLCVDHVGYVYVADTAASKIVVVSPAGVEVTSFSPGYPPYDTAVSPDGNYLYVAGGPSGEAGTVARYTITR